MKKLLLFFVLCVCVLQLNAQNRVEFLGMQISGNTKTAFVEKLKEKGYRYKGESEGYIMYAGQFVGVEADIMLVPSGKEDGITGVHVSITEINPAKMGQLFSELLQKLMGKYQDYKYTTNIKSNGDTQIMFRKVQPNGLCDFVSIESGVTGTNCKLFIDYGVDMKMDTPTNNSAGVGIDDI